MTKNLLFYEVPHRLLSHILSLKKEENTYPYFYITDLAVQTKTAYASTHIWLKRFEKSDLLVSTLIPGQPTIRVYKVTEKGMIFLDSLSKMNEILKT